MASRKEYEMLFQLNAQISNSYNSTFSKAQAQLATMQKEIQSLSKTQSDISAYQKQQGAVESTRSKLAVLQQQYDNIQKEIKETEGYSSSLENKLLSKQQQIERTTASLNEQTAKLDRLGDALRDAGIDTDNLAKESSELAAKIGDIKERQTEVASSAKQFGNSSVDAFEEIQAAMAAAGMAKAFKEIAEEIVECTKASIEFESAITGVYKTVDGTDEQLAAISQGIKDMSTEIPATTTEISAVAEAAGQLGIATEDVLSFTRVMIDLGESTNLTADDAASALAKFANITGTAADNYSRLGSVVVDLGNNFATTEADIVAMSTRLASAGTLAGFSEAEIMALAAAMSSVGIEAEAGGTAMTQTLNTIETAVAENGDAVIEFARISGMSAAEFSQAWEERPIEALQAFIAGLGNLDEQGESAVLVLDELGLTGIRQSNMLKSLGLAADTLGDSISTANKAWDENTALSIEANKRYATTESQLAMLQNSYSNLQVAIGDVYAPTLLKVSEIGSALLEDVTEFVEKNPEVVKMITAAAVGVGAFALALTGYIVVSKLAEKATRALTAAMQANPYLLVGTAIVGVVAGLATLIATSAEAEDESQKLTSASIEQREELDALNAEYERTCDLYGETSYQAQELAWEIEDLTAEYENGKQTMEEYRAAFDESMQSYYDMVEQHEEAAEEMQKESASVFALINRLDELTKQTDVTAAEQQEILAIIKALNAEIPGLSLSYDTLTNSMSNSKEAIMALAEAELRSREYDTYYEQLLEKMGKRTELANNITTATENQAAAQKQYNELAKEYNDWYEQHKSSLNTKKNASQMGTYWAELNELAEKYNEFTTDLKEATKAQEENEAAITELTEKMAELSGAVSENTGEFHTYEQGVEVALQSVQSQINDLCTAYDEAYATARESIDGQISLFQKMVLETETSVADMQTAWESQVSYLQTYSTNIQKAMDFGLDKSLVQQLSDGSEESAAYLDTIIKKVEALGGTTDSAKKFVDDFNKKFQEVEQAKDEWAETVGKMETDFEQTCESLQKQLNETIDGLNMNADAAAAAKETMDAYIAEIIAGGNSAVAAAASAAARVRAALSTGVATTTNTGVTSPGFTGSSGNTVYEGYSASAIQQELRDLKRRNSSGTYDDLISQMQSWLTANGYAKGTDNATRGVHLVGENGPELVYFNGGERVLTAEETEAMQSNIQLVAMAPQLMAALNAYGAYTSADRTDAVGGYYVAPVSIQVTFQIEGNPTPETVEALNEYGDDFAERVLEIIEDAGIDVARRSYT